MLQELREQVTAATRLVAEIGLRFEQGDPATDQLAQLEPQLAAVIRRASGATDVPADLRDDLAALFAAVRDTVAAGDVWLARAGPELATQHARERLRRAYGVP